MNTPSKRTSPRKQPKTPPRSPGPCPYKGTKLQVPGEIFEQQESFSAEVKGWSAKRTDQLVVKFDDGTQYWFPLDDVLKWMGEEPAAAPAAQLLTPSSPAAADTHSTPRRSTRQTTAAAAAAAAAESSGGRRRQIIKQGDEQQQEEDSDDDSGATAATADEVFDMPLWQQEKQLQPLGRRQRLRRRLQRAAGFDETRSEAVVAAGVLLALLVMVAAVWLARWPAHDLEASLDAASAARAVS